MPLPNNLNFSSPENEIGYWQLSSSCNGIAEACKVLETPVTGGNVSLYNESKNKDNLITPINPTPVIGMVGKIDNVEKAISSEWKNIEDESKDKESSEKAQEDPKDKAQEETKEERRELNVKYVSCDLTRDNQNSNLTLAAQLEVSLAPCQKGLQGTFLKGLDFLTMAGFNCKLIYL